MAKLTAPLMSMDASGSVGSTLTFAKWKGRKYVRSLVRPHNPKSSLQVAVRAVMTFVTQAWKTLNATKQGHWTTAGKKDQITGLNEMVRTNQQAARQGLGVYDDTPQPASVVPANITAEASTSGFRQISFTWNDSVTATAWCVFIWGKKVNANVAPAFDVLLAVIARGQQKWTHMDLTTGDTWSYTFEACDASGSFAAAAVHDNGIVVG